MVNTEGKEERKLEGDAAATDAENELNTDSQFSDEVVGPMADWWYKHYHRAGHKRLGRILADIGKQRAERGAS